MQKELELIVQTADSKIWSNKLESLTKIEQLPSWVVHPVLISGPVFDKLINLVT